MLKRLWILGHGRVMVHQQFLVDYKRLTLFFDGNEMPCDVRDGVMLLLEKTGNMYYKFLKFMNQTIGNMAFEQLQKVTTDDHLVVRGRTFTVSAFSRPRSKVVCSFQCTGYNKMLLQTRLYRAHMEVDLDTYRTIFSCSI